MAASAVAVGLSATIVATNAGLCEDEEVDPSSRKIQILSPSFNWYHHQQQQQQPHVAKCEGAFLSMPRGLRRHSTVQKLEEIAAEDRLEDMYHVNFKAPLGEGTFGAVYAAKHKVSGEDVAVKKINKRNTTSVAFQREMDALLLLRDNGG